MNLTPEQLKEFSDDFHTKVMEVVTIAIEHQDNMINALPSEDRAQVLMHQMTENTTQIRIIMEAIQNCVTTFIEKEK